METLPNQTVYVSNLDESITKQELRRTLYNLYSQYGAIVDVVALKTTKMRGQAFIVFRDLSAATNALRNTNGFNLFGRPVRISYAKDKSHAIMKEDGTFGKHKGQVRSGGNTDERAGNQAKVRKVEPPKSKPAPVATIPLEPMITQPVNNILFLTNLPAETTDTMLQMLFGQLNGFKEVRLIQNRPDIAFVEYDTEPLATAAMDTLQGFKVTPTNPIQINYAKK